MFSFFKKKKTSEIKRTEAEKGSVEFQLELRPHLVDNFFVMKLPVEFVPYESDKFRAKTDDGKKMITITNYQTEWKGNAIDKHFFEELKLNLYEVFVKEGGYEPYDDLVVTDQFIRKSFKVDEETQYYFTSARVIGDKVIMTDFIVREIGPYNRTIMPTLEVVNKSIEVYQG
ncbi:MAG: hypothetical protein LBV72_04795 [Tannerella sp.]|nr:hypothetical protein [Tannerella sp.]